MVLDLRTGADSLMSSEKRTERLGRRICLLWEIAKQSGEMHQQHELYFEHPWKNRTFFSHGGRRREEGREEGRKGRRKSFLRTLSPSHAPCSPHYPFLIAKERSTLWSSQADDDLSLMSSSCWNCSSENIHLLAMLNERALQFHYDAQKKRYKFSMYVIYNYINNTKRRRKTQPMNWNFFKKIFFFFFSCSLSLFCPMSVFLSLIEREMYHASRHSRVHQSLLAFRSPRWGSGTHRYRINPHTTITKPKK